MYVLIGRRPVKTNSLSGWKRLASLCQHSKPQCGQLRTKYLFRFFPNLLCRWVIPGPHLKLTLLIAGGARAMHFPHDFLPGLPSHLATLAEIFMTGDNIYLVCFLSLTHFLTLDRCDLKGNYKSPFQIEKQPWHSGVNGQGTLHQRTEAGYFFRQCLPP